MSYWAKIIYEGEGVVDEREFKTQAEADAFVIGAELMRSCAPDSDAFEGLYACIGDTEARDAE